MHSLKSLETEMWTMHTLSGTKVLGPRYYASTMAIVLGPTF